MKLLGPAWKKFERSTQKKFLIFLEMEVSSLIFFLYFRRELSELKTYPEKYYGKWNFPKKLFYISGGTYKAPKPKFLIFLKKNL